MSTGYRSLAAPGVSCAAACRVLMQLLTRQRSLPSACKSPQVRQEGNIQRLCWQTNSRIQRPTHPQREGCVGGKRPRYNTEAAGESPRVFEQNFVSRQQVKSLTCNGSCRPKASKVGSRPQLRGAGAFRYGRIGQRSTAICWGRKAPGGKRQQVKQSWC